MFIVTVLLVFVAGMACGLALRPGLDRRRQLRRAWAIARERRRSGIAAPVEDLPFVPRDYYLAERRQRGTLAEGFGLKRRAEDQTAVGTGDTVNPQTEIDFQQSMATPRDYYERNTADDEGTLSEGYGLRTPPARDSGPT